MCRYKREDGTCVLDGIQSLECHVTDNKEEKCIYFQVQEKEDATV